MRREILSSVALWSLSQKAGPKLGRSCWFATRCTNNRDGLLLRWTQHTAKCWIFGLLTSTLRCALEPSTCSKALEPRSWRRTKIPSPHTPPCSRCRSRVESLHGEVGESSFTEDLARCVDGVDREDHRSDWQHQLRNIGHHGSSGVNKDKPGECQHKKWCFVYVVVFVVFLPVSF